MREREVRPEDEVGRVSHSPLDWGVINIRAFREEDLERNSSNPKELVELHVLGKHTVRVGVCKSDRLSQGRSVSVNSSDVTDSEERLITSGQSDRGNSSVLLFDIGEGLILHSTGNLLASRASLPKHAPTATIGGLFDVKGAFRHFLFNYRST